MEMLDHDVSAIPPEEGGCAEEELAYRLRQQQLTALFGAFALRTSEISALLQEATRISAEGLQSKFCKVLEYLPDEEQLLVRAGVGWKPGVVGHARMGADLESPAGYALKSGLPVISNHLENETRFRTARLLADHGIKRAINVIIRGDGDPYGVLEVDSSSEGRFTEHDLAFLQGFASLLGLAIEKQRALDATRTNESLLQRALTDQEFLAREVSHRVKNSLQLVSSFLGLQGRSSDDPSLKSALSDAESRVVTIAQLHERLWRQDQVSQIDLSEYLEELCEHLRRTSPEHLLICELASVVLPTDQAVSVGLLVNELVTNAFKHAYPGGSGEVALKLEASDGERVRLQVCDQGTGLQSEFDASGSKSLGMRLVANLARQLGGEAEWRDAKPGTCFVLDMKKQEAKR